MKRAETTEKRKLEMIRRERDRWGLEETGQGGKEKDRERERGRAGKTRRANRHAKVFKGGERERKRKKHTC